VQIDFVDRGSTVQTAPQVCMHCTDATCAMVCPADAIKIRPDGIVQSALKPRCIGCSNCVLACPFGVPKYVSEFDQMMKCDMCYDRSSIGLTPMCASVCPSGALWFGKPSEFEATRPGFLENNFRFGAQQITTSVYTVSETSLGTAIDMMADEANGPWQNDPFGLSTGPTGVVGGVNLT
jgi:Fe-S-cluster-containing dehydrogenase component